jgi:hypothetical protein
VTVVTTTTKFLIWSTSTPTVLATLSVKLCSCSADTVEEVVARLKLTLTVTVSPVVGVKEGFRVTEGSKVGSAVGLGMGCGMGWEVGAGVVVSTTPAVGFLVGLETPLHTPLNFPKRMSGQSCLPPCPLIDGSELTNKPKSTLQLCCPKHLSKALKEFVEQHSW